MRDTDSRSARPVLIITGLTENPGGKEAFIRSLIFALAEDYRIVVPVDRLQVAHREELEERGVEFLTIPHRRNAPFGYLRAWWTLLSDLEPEALWLNATVISSIEPLVLSSIRGVPVRVLHSHSSSNMSGSMSGLLHRLQKPLARIVANRRFACSEPAARWFFGGADWVFVPNVFDAASFGFDREARRATREALGIEESTTVLIHVARLGPAKNHVFDIEIMSALRNSTRRFLLLLVGDGPFRSELESRVTAEGLGECVRFLGPRNDVPQLLSAADLSILPSTFEGLPYTALEAQASGLPIILSDAVSRRCVVEGARVLSLPIDKGPDQWVEAIEELAKARGERGENLLRGSEFDAASSRSAFLRLLGS